MFAYVLTQDSIHIFVGGTARVIRKTDISYAAVCGVLKDFECRLIELSAALFPPDHQGCGCDDGTDDYLDDDDDYSPDDNAPPDDEPDDDDFEPNDEIEIPPAPPALVATGFPDQPLFRHKNGTHFASADVISIVKDIGQREFSRKYGVPRSTLQGWLRKANAFLTSQKRKK